MLVKYNGDGPDVVIPEYYNGKPVVSVGRDCFEGKEEKILSLTINACGDNGNIASAAFKPYQPRKGHDRRERYRYRRRNLVLQGEQRV